MISALPFLLGSSGTLSMATLVLLFTGNLLAMALTAAAAIVLATIAVPLLAQQEEAEYFT
ncbi:hypothetical protein [Deinococcus sp. QL22]|uniref:hypothetical protein n=1 Tax=Deinococcus sp. QL22 TaxID=2939437 RepID=UPI002016E653|nr:hypothetical protein [Deinococcus sp. QL22]UQN08117.1 hypothetical protein M1R55_18700 [Deinococcus sp. QL22]